MMDDDAPVFGSRYARACGVSEYGYASAGEHPRSI
jgi:hypothetical protein